MVKTVVIDEDTLPRLQAKKMQLSEPLQLLCNDTKASSSGVLARCEAANFRWEPAVSDARAIEYGVYVGDAPDRYEWKAEHKDYLSNFVQVPRDLPRSAECFMAINLQAHLDEQMDNTYLIRLESLGHLLGHPLMGNVAEQFWDRFFNSPKDLRKLSLSPADEALRTAFTMHWNEQRTQARPLFAAFLNDFGGNVDALVKQDWPHLLRNRLGLIHWPSTIDKALPVALMCYSINDVRAARQNATKKGAVASLARPTVLDAEFSAAFVPAPMGHGGGCFGHTLDLASHTIPVKFTAELLTYSIEYLPTYIKALGFISDAHDLDDNSMFAARNRHVQGLQALPGYADFGEVLI